MTIDGEARELRDVLVGAIHEDRLYLGNEVPVRTGIEGWVFVVAHVIDGSAPDLGTEALVEVDAGYRFSLSAAHTACHLAALALDEALAEFWTKPAPLEADGAGLSGRRQWVCELPEGDVSLPCGGTHVTSLSQLSAAVVDFEVSGEGNTREVLMTTRVTVVES